jgi:putative hydrolase of the HAD superfamily
LNRYRHIFFDLDHTLWDYDRNVRESLDELFDIYSLHSLGVSTIDDFYEAFNQVNFKLWSLYNNGKIDKSFLRKERFKRIFEYLGTDGLAVPLEMEEDFMTRTSSKSHVFPYSTETLAYLKQKYQLHIITNGFDESQALKMASSGLTSYFQLIVTSETTGHRKPDKRIFEYALEKLNTIPSACLMVGDNPESDIIGAKNAQIDQVLFNPLEIPCLLNPTYTITCLSELKTFL